MTKPRTDKIAKRISAMPVKERDALMQKLKRKVIGSPTGLEPPSLVTIMDNLVLALNRPDTFTDHFYDLTAETINEAVECLVAIKSVFDKIVGARYVR